MDYQLTLNPARLIGTLLGKTAGRVVAANFIDPLSPDELAGLASGEQVDSRLGQPSGWKCRSGHVLRKR